MPNIVINEVDKTTPGTGSQKTDIVFVPGFATTTRSQYTDYTQRAKMNVPIMCNTVNEFERYFGNQPATFAEDQEWNWNRVKDSQGNVYENIIDGFKIELEDYERGTKMFSKGDPDPSYIYAKELLALGIPVLYVRINKDNEKPSVKKMYSALSGVGYPYEESGDTIFTQLLDKGEYTVKFITSGGYPSFGWVADGVNIVNDVTFSSDTISNVIVSEENFLRKYTNSGTYTFVAQSSSIDNIVIDKDVFLHAINSDLSEISDKQSHSYMIKVSKDSSAEISIQIFNANGNKITPVVDEQDSQHSILEKIGIKIDESSLDGDITISIYCMTNLVYSYNNTYDIVTPQDNIPNIFEDESYNNYYCEKFSPITEKPGTWETDDWKIYSIGSNEFENAGVNKYFRKYTDDAGRSYYYSAFFEPVPGKISDELATKIGTNGLVYIHEQDSADGNKIHELKRAESINSTTQYFYSKLYKQKHVAENKISSCYFGPAILGSNITDWEQQNQNSSFYCLISGDDGLLHSCIEGGAKVDDTTYYKFTKNNGYGMESNILLPEFISGQVYEKTATNPTYTKVTATSDNGSYKSDYIKILPFSGNRFYKPSAEVLSENVVSGFSENYYARLTTKDVENNIEKSTDTFGQTVIFMLNDSTVVNDIFDYITIDGDIVNGDSIDVIVSASGGAIIPVKMETIAKTRGDAIALIDHTNNPNRPLESTNPHSIYYRINENGTEKAVTSDGTYGAMFTPWFNFTTPYTGTVIDLPPSFAYLVGLARSIQNNNQNWLSIAGVTRGQVAYYNKVLTSTNLTQKIADSYQPRTGATVNPITKVKPYGYVIWGNRTLHKNAENLTASSFLDIRNMVSDIKRVVYDTAMKLIFEKNSDVLWAKFCTGLNIYLDKLQSGQGITGYKIIKGQTDEKAKLAAIVRISPIYSLEDVDVTIELVDEDVIVR